MSTSSSKRTSSGDSTRASAKKHKLEPELNDEEEEMADSAAPISPLSSSDQDNEEGKSGCEHKPNLGILDSIKKNNDKSAVVKNGFIFLISLVQDSDEEALMNDIIQAGGISTVVAAMKNHPTAQGLQDEGRVLLELLCEKVGKTPDNDGIVAILSIMKELADDVGLLETCCDVLYVVSDNGFAEFIGETGGVAQLISVLKKHVNDEQEDLALSCLGALVKLTYHAISNRQRIADGGGIAVVVDTIKRFKSPSSWEFKSPGSCNYGIMILLNVAIGSERKNRAKAIIDNGGHIEIISSMNAFPTHESLQQSGCWALSNLACDDIDGSLERIVEAGAVATIVAAMKRYPGNVTAQQYACHALHNLTKGGQAVRDAIIQAGGLEAIGGAIRVHRNNQVIESAAKQTLEDLMESI